MAHVNKDRVKETTTTTGTGPFTVSGAMTGFKALSSVCSVGDTFRGVIQAVDGNGVPTGEWQSGTFTYSGANQVTTLVVEESSTGSAVSFSAGTKQVWIGMNATQASWVREKLTAARTYYVRTDGSDSNDGLSNTAGGAFLTIQKAVDVVSGTLDVSTYQVTIQVADGTYTTPVSLKPWLGAKEPIINGNTTTPSSCVINTTSANAVTSSYPGMAWTVKGFKLTTTTSGNGFYVTDSSKVTFSNIDFGAVAGSFPAHIYTDRDGIVFASGNYSITGAAFAHVWPNYGGGVNISYGATVTITGTPAFSGAYLYSRNGWFQADTITYSGSATGVRYNLSLNAVAFTNAGTLPGSSAGTTATGGQYV